MTPTGKRTILWRVLKALWVLACVWILVLALIYRGPQYRDDVEGEFLVMMGLSFPSGWLFPFMLKLMEMLKLFDGSHATELQEIFVTWVPLFILGYLQWFVVVPAVARWWRRRFPNSKASYNSFIPKE
ncbi:MAG: hypothetical protein WBC78_11175 [Candidatus Sulfotelmatobacter sp.]